MTGRGRGVHDDLRNQFKKPRGPDGRFVSGRPRGPIANFRPRGPTVDPFKSARTLARSPPPATRISLSPPDGTHTASSGELDESPNFGEVSYQHSIEDRDFVPPFHEQSFNAEHFEQFEDAFHNLSGTPPVPPPLPPPSFLKQGPFLRRRIPENRPIMTSIDTIARLIPKCDPELKNLPAFIGTCDHLHRKVSAEDRPLFCLMIRSRAAECSMYDLIRGLSDEAGWEEIKTALSTESTPPMSRNAALAQISNLKQKSNEPIQEYAKRARGFLRQLK